MLPIHDVLALLVLFAQELLCTSDSTWVEASLAAACFARRPSSCSTKRNISQTAQCHPHEG
eukprot:664351-Amphidinium_carterae.1